VSDLAKRVAELGRDPSVRAAIKKDQDDDRREEAILRDMTSIAARLSSDDRHQALAQLRQRWKDLSDKARNPVDSTERQLARRVLGALSADGTNDAEYSKIIAEYRMGRGADPPPARPR